MDKYPCDANTRVWFVPTVENLVTIAIDNLENTGTDITCELTADGLSLPVSTESIRRVPWRSDVIVDQPTRYGISSARLIGFRARQGEPEPLWGLAQFRDTGYLIVRRGIPYEQDWAEGDSVEVYSIVFGQRAMAPTASNTLSTFEVPIFVLEYSDDSVIVPEIPSLLDLATAWWVAARRTGLSGLSLADQNGDVDFLNSVGGGGGSVPVVNDDGTYTVLELRTGDFLGILDTDQIDPESGDFSAVLVTKPQVNLTGTKLLWSKRTGAAAGWNLFLNGAVPTATFDDDVSAAVQATGPTVTLGSRHVIAVVKEGAAWRVSVDGIPGDIETVSLNSITNAEPMRLNLNAGGASVDGNQDLYGAAWFKGTALSSSQILEVRDLLLANDPITEPPPEPSLEPDGDLTAVANWATPYSGVHAEESTGPYWNSLWSTDNHIFLGAPVTIAGVQQSRAARCSKTGVEQQDVQLNIRAHDVLIGHRGVSVITELDGTLHTQAERHNAPWRGKHSATPLDLTTLINTTSPATAGFDSYTRFFRNPVTDEIWLCLRGDGQDGYGYLWDGAAWVQKIHTADAGYGQNLGFAPDGTIYCTIDILSSGPGFPRSDTGLVKSVDNGTTWTDMDDNPCPATIDTNDATIAFPTTGAPNVAAAQVFVLPDGTVIVTAEYRDDVGGDLALQLYEAVWNGTSFDRTRITNHADGVGYSLCSMQDGQLITTCITSRATGGPLMAYARQADDSWEELTLATGFWWGAQHDPNSHVDGVFRIMPLSKTFSHLHGVWEFNLADFTVP